MAIKSLSALFKGGTKVVVGGYNALKTPLDNWEGSKERKKYALDLIKKIDIMQQESIDNIQKQISPDGLCEAFIENKFSQKAEMEQRMQLNLSDSNEQLESLHAEKEQILSFKDKLLKEKKNG
nr:MAG: hypothetical protein B6I27_02310 [Erwiniaceae bacterium 4572_131]